MQNFKAANLTNKQTDNLVKRFIGSETKHIKNYSTQPKTYSNVRGRNIHEQLCCVVVMFNINR